MDAYGVHLVTLQDFYCASVIKVRVPQSFQAGCLVCVCVCVCVFVCV